MSYHFSVRLTATLSLCLIHLKLIVHELNSVARAHMILKQIRQRLRVAVSRVEK